MAFCATPTVPTSLISILKILTEETMDSKVTYLAIRSLAVYEISLIEQYGETHRRMLRQQAACALAMLQHE